MNVPFTALLRSKGIEKRAIAYRLGLSPSCISDRLAGRKSWQWPEVCTVCQMLDISLDEFATYFPAGRVKPGKPHEPTRAERIDSVLAELREILV